LSYHAHSVKKALLDLFPEIGLNESHFVVCMYKEENERGDRARKDGNEGKGRKGERREDERVLNNSFLAWNNKEEGKIFFENFAKLHGFDPLVAANWYRQSVSDLLALKVSSPSPSASLPLLSLSPPLFLKLLL